MQEVVTVQLAKISAVLAIAVGLLAIGLLVEDESIRGVALFSVGLLGAPILLLVLRDTGGTLRRAGVTSPRARSWGRVLGLPEAAVGFICVLAGMALVPLYVYKWWSQGQTLIGPWIALPVGLCLLGLALMRNAFAVPRELVSRVTREPENSETSMGAVQRLKQVLGERGIPFVEEPSSITVKAAGPMGFDVTLNEEEEETTVFYEGWHDHFADPREAVRCFLAGISSLCRIRVTERGGKSYKWVLERFDGGRWIPYSTVALLFFQFWRAPKVKYLRNGI